MFPTIMEGSANQRPESRSRDPLKPIRREDEDKEKDIDLKIRELEGVIPL